MRQLANQETRRRIDSQTALALLGAARLASESAGHALARLCGPSEVSIHPVELVSGGPHELAAALGRREPHCAVRFEVSGGARARVAVVLDSSGSDLLAARLLRREPASEGVRRHPDGRAALAELGNIVASSYLTGFGAAAHVTLLPSLPALQEDEPAALLDPWPEGMTLFTRFELQLAGGVALGAFLAWPDESTLASWQLLLDSAGKGETRGAE